ncbi:protein kinase [Antrihabitans sp. YC3-6]|uniref:Protein kinase n=1 Tax=Antrihabitans stalagmiti TaxID=2799499 RepID=A0A934NRY0_9NOCA|nr:serine/threonine-protein kinase [Antrihabitans stalagmiti]MBJ8340223.1 protein kinase [Antrihabitans stalagmiti]
MTGYEGDPSHPADPSLQSELAAAGFEGATEVGRGGFGVVYRCWQPALGRTVAIKLLSSDLDRENRERFLREGYAMGRLSGHPNIVNILQLGVTATGRPYIVMPYLAKDSLATRVRRDGNFEWPDAVRIGVKLAGALQTAHEGGTLHRDVKPANVLVGDYGEPQLTDFGIARIAGGFETATGAFTGSLAYTAPEVLKGRPPTIAADIYGLGATIFALIAGRAAYERKTDEELIAQFLRISTTPIPDLRPNGVPDDVCRAIERAMADDPAGRWQTSADFGNALREAQQQHGLKVEAMALPSGDDEVTEYFTAPPTGHSGPSHRSGPHYQPVLPYDAAFGQPSGPSTQHAVPAAASGPHHRAPNPVGAERKRRGLAFAVAAVAALVVAASVGGVVLARNDSTGSPIASSASSAPSTVAAAVPLEWRSLKDAKLARQQSATVVDDGTIWVFGGLDNNGSTAAVQGYDPAIDTWKSGPDLPLALNHPMAVAYRGELIVIGGWEPSGADLTAKTSDRVFALRNGAWVDIAKLARPRAAGAAVVVDDKIVVVGGQWEDQQLSTTTEIFDGTAWRVAPGVITPREHLAATTDGKSVFAVGGRDLSADKNSGAMEAYDLTSEVWTSLPAMPTPRGGLGAVYVDGRIMTVGGEEPTRVLGTVESYDIVSRSWSALPPMHTPRHGLAVAAVGNWIYAIGGASKPTHAASIATTEALALPARSAQPAEAWRQLDDARLARQQSATAMSDGTIWVFGGLDNEGSTGKVQGYDPAIDTWKSGPDLPIALNHPMAVDYRGELVVIGGWEPQGHDLTATTSDRVFVLRDGAWVELPRLPEPRAAGAAAVVGDQIIVTGGQANSTLSTTTAVFDGTAWRDAPGAPTAREHLAAATDGTYLYALGGRDLSSDKNTGAVERYDPATRTWTTLAAMPTPRGGLGAVYVDGRIVAVGGEEPTRVLGTVEAFDVATGTWATFPALHTARHGLAVAAVGNTVYAIGGGTKPTHAQSTAATEALDFS